MAIAKIHTLLLVFVQFGLLGSAGPAVRIEEFRCTLTDGNGVFVATNSSSVVITISGNGNLVCKADVTPSADGKAVSYDFESTGGALCYTLTGATSNWHQVVSASGKASLTCHTNN